MLYRHLKHHNDTIIKTQEDFFRNIFTSLFIARVRKGLLKVCVWEGAGDLTELKYFDLHSYGQQRCVFLVLLMLQHLLWTPIHQGSWGPLRPGVAFPTTSRLHSDWNSNSTGSWFLSWLRYIIIQRPHDRPLDLWNRMLSRHQAEITVMQFTGHSLPVHQSMSVSWEFFRSSHFISQFPPTRFPLITAIRMCHFLPVHHLGMAFLAGFEGQNIT